MLESSGEAGLEISVESKQYPRSPEHPSYLHALSCKWFLEESAAFNSSFSLSSLSDEPLILQNADLNFR